MIVTGAVSGPLISTCSATPSSASTVRSRPRRVPNGSSPGGWPVPLRIRLTAYRSAATSAPAPAAVAPTTRPAAPVIRRQLAIGPPAACCFASGRCATRGARSGCRSPPSPPRRARAVLLCYSEVASWYSPAEAGGDLVGDRAYRVGPVLGRRLARIARPEQQYLVPFSSGFRAEVNHEHVHGHRARDEPAPAPGIDLDQAGRVPRHAFGVAHRNEPQGAPAAGHVPVAVGHPGTRRHLLDLHQPGPHGHRRPQPGRHRAGQGGQACHPAAAPHQVEPGLWQGQRGRGVGQVADLGLDARLFGDRDGLAEHRHLGVDRPVTRHVRAGQMGPQANYLDLASCLGRQGGGHQARPLRHGGPASLMRQRTGAVRPARRTASPSSTLITPSQLAPPASAAVATGIRPWPYASALTTAMTLAWPTCLRSPATLSRTVARLTSACAGASMTLQSARSAGLWQGPVLVFEVLAGADLDLSAVNARVAR